MIFSLSTQNTASVVILSHSRYLSRRDDEIEHYHLQIYF
jgi:hypothetical protein